MRSKLVDIGTSRGIRIPKYLLDKYHFTNSVEINDTGSGILIETVKQPRAGWKESFETASSGDEALQTELPESEWDKTEWEW